MAGACAAIRSHVIGPTVIKLSRTNNVSNCTGAPFSVRISTGSNGGRVFSASVAEGPSCIFVGPIDSASRETLEALYRQARNAYYSGKPLIVDNMFDRVEKSTTSGLGRQWVYGRIYLV